MWSIYHCVVRVFGCLLRPPGWEQGTIGYDVAVMRLSYMRLKWDSSALDRIMYGDISRKRRGHTQGLTYTQVSGASHAS